LYTNIETGESVIDIWKDHRDIEDDLPYKRTIRHKASVNIMYGCNKFCTYCIVPYVRGRERSRSRDEIIKEIVAIANDGVKEITLLGQNVNSYGLGLKEKVSFANILQDVCKISGIERVRFMTSYPNDFTDELIQVIKNNPQICKYIHLPVQSGSNRILKCMKRGYSREEFLNLVYKIRASIPGVHLTTDIIVGFPGETEEDFSQTLDLVKEVEFLNAYTFIYSKREGTRASIMDEQVPESISRDRFNRLIYTLNSITKKIMKSKLYTMEDILVDGVNEKDDKFLMGRTDSNILVYFRGHKELIGNTVKVRVVGTKTFYLNGEVL
jgi:tRNA-2-methylthio-N6-dimethylallyladenosine synthase